MNQPKPKPAGKAKAETSVAQTLPSRARAREADATLTAEEIAPASAAYQIRFARTETLTPYVRNAQLHDEAQVAAIAASIEEFGFVGAVAADDKGILAGHGRTLAAAKLYGAGKRIKAPNGVLIPDGTVPWIDCAGWSDAQRRAYIIADNQLVRRAGQDFELLRLEMSELQGLDFDLNLLGFDAEALDAIMNPRGAEAEPEGEGDGDPALDEPEAPTVIHCPKCQHQFSVLEEKPAQPKRKKAA